jgi:cytochrome c peroxidase
MRGNTGALTRNELEGLRLFLKDGCTKCHNGPMFSDYKTHIMGVPEQDKLKYSDSGYAKSYAFRTPSLRNLSHTYPYMHNGKLKSLENVLEFYEDLSGGKQANSRLQFSQIDPLVANLNVDFKDIAFIVEFLGALNDEPVDKSIPARVPSHLIVGGNIH